VSVESASGLQIPGGSPNPNPGVLIPQGRNRALECRSAQPDFGCSEVVAKPPWCV
jgi:hypothetical protein